MEKIFLVSGTLFKENTRHFSMRIYRLIFHLHLTVYKYMMLNPRKIQLFTFKVIVIISINHLM
jgi:hypothetical protein